MLNGHHRVTKKKSIRTLKPGMLLTSVRASHDCMLLRLETKDDLDVPCKGLVGDMALCEVRKRRPAVISPEKLQENDTPSVITGSEHREEHFVARSELPGVDFLHDNLQTLRIFVRCKRHQFRISTGTQKPVDCPDEKLARIVERLPSNVSAAPEIEDEAVNAVVAASKFEFEDEVFRVDVVDKVARTALCISLVDRSEAAFNFEDIAPLIIERMEQSALESTVN